MGLLIVYLTGLVLGIGCFALTFYFSKEIELRKRMSILIVISIFGILGGLVIGGFEGMPVSVVGAGILTIALLLKIEEKSLLWRKIIFISIIFGSLAVFAYEILEQYNGTNFVVAAKDERLDADLKSHYEWLQVRADVKGFKTFEMYEGEKAIVLSLGEEKVGNNIEVLGVEKRSGQTIVKIKTFENKSTEKNPSIIIYFEKLEPNMMVMDTDGTIYNEIQ